MTSFTRKLYSRDPAAAEQFGRQQAFEHRMSYGKSVTLACFTPAFHAVDVAFGKRTVAPALPAYECWVPDERGFGARPLKPKAVVRAPDGFQARKEYAKHHGVSVTEVAARRVGA